MFYVEIKNTIIINLSLRNATFGLKENFNSPAKFI